MAKLEIVIRNTHFSVVINDSSLYRVINSMTDYLVSMKLEFNPYTKKTKMVKDKNYFVKSDNTYRFNINMLKRFMLLLRDNYVSKDDILVKEDKQYPVMPLELTLSDDYEPRDYQHLYINELTKPRKSYNTNLLVDLQTGRGKGYLTTYALVQMNMRTMFILLPKYIKKWVLELQDYTDVDIDDIYVIQGSGSLIKLMEEEDPDYKFIIFSITTMNNYIRDYEKDPNSYPIEPSEFLRHIKAGITVNDEAHQHFHAVYKAMLYFNSVKHIGLSATLESNDKSIVKIYDTMYPEDSRISNLIEYNKYIVVKSIRYNISNIKALNYKRAQGYNHILFEQSIMNYSVLLRAYIEMVEYYFISEYFNRRIHGEKCIIFCASIRMATILSNYFQGKHKDLDIRRYVEDDPYENIVSADVTITTPNSGGTAIDVPGLINVIDTTSIGSRQLNIQIMGRLREIKGRDVVYTYLYCSDISNQNNLSRLRLEAIAGKAKTVIRDSYNKVLKTR